jgi:hypothetical protein
VVRRAIAIVVLAAAPARAEPLPTTWLTNDLVLGSLPAAGANCDSIGLGFGLDHAVVGHLELAIEAQALQVESPDNSDPRTGFGLRGVATIGYAIPVWRRMGVELEPKLGVSSAVVFGLGPRDRTPDAVFVALRLGARLPLESPALGNARGWGAHYELRLERSGGSLVIGWDWGF